MLRKTCIACVPEYNAMTRKINFTVNKAPNYLVIKLIKYYENVWVPSSLLLYLRKLILVP
jgi:hypothetical protein